MSDPSEPTIGLALHDSRTTPGPLPYRPGAPNVVMIVLDDLGFAQLGCYGSDIDTPNIDRLAAGPPLQRLPHDRDLLTHRACLLTGRNHHRVGMGCSPTSRCRIPATPVGSRGRRGRWRRSSGDAGWVDHGDRQVAPRAPRRAGDRPLDQWPPVWGSTATTASSTARPTSGRRTWSATRSHVEPPCDTRGRLPPRRRPRRRGDRPIPRAAGCTTRTGRSCSGTPPGHRTPPPGAAGVDRALPGPLRRRVGRVARARRSPARSSRLLLPDGVELSPRPPWVEAWDHIDADRRRLYARMMEVFAGGRHPPRPSDRKGPRRGRAGGQRTTRWSSSCRTTVAPPRAVRAGRWNQLRHYVSDEPDDVEAAGPPRRPRWVPLQRPLPLGLGAGGQHAVRPVEALHARGRRARPAGSCRGPATSPTRAASGTSTCTRWTCSPRSSTSSGSKPPAVLHDVEQMTFDGVERPHRAGGPDGFRPTHGSSTTSAGAAGRCTPTAGRRSRTTSTS